MDLSKYIDLYLSDGREHLAALRAGLPESAGEAPADVNALFRHAHSLKGMAASMGFEATAALSHALESLLGTWRAGALPTAPAVLASLEALDLLEALTDAVQTSGGEGDLVPPAQACAKKLSGVAGAPATPAPAAAAASPPAPAASPEVPSPSAQGPEARVTVAIDASSALPAARLLVVSQRLQQAFGRCTMEPPLAEVQAGNLRRARFRVPLGPGLKEAARQLRELAEVAEVTLEVCQAGPAARGEAAVVPSVRIPAPDLDDLLTLTSDLLHHLNLLESGLGSVERRHHRFWLEKHRALLDGLFDRVLSVRLVPFELLTERLARLVRDLSARTGKPLRFEVSGADQKVDRALLERLLDPLSHLLRNSADHGVEPRQERRERGKPEEGLLSLEIQREGEALLVSVRDDGRGLDETAIARAAVERGLLTSQEAALLTRKQILEFITLPAFSTRSEVSELSGRGVGMDVVRAAAESLGGRLEMASEAGKGSRFTLAIPSAATLTQVLVFGWTGAQRFGVPASQVRRIFPLSAHPLVWVGSRRCLRAGDDLLPVLSWRGGPVGRDGCALALSGPEGEKVLLVSDVYQTERVVIHPWGPPLDMIPHWIGGALLSSGEIAYIVDGRALARQEERTADVSPAP